MKSGLSWLGVLSFLLLTCSAHSKEVISLDKSWKFHLMNNASASQTQTVNLPHTWNREDALAGNGLYYRGLCTYSKTLQMEESWRKKRLFLRFEGASMVADVFINNNYVATHLGGYTAFNVEITDFIRFDKENKIEVKVNNAMRMDLIPLDGDFNFYGGLYRNVSLLISDSVCISPLHYGSTGVYITQRKISGEKALFGVDVLLSAPEKSIGKEVEISFTLYDANHRSLLSEKKTQRISNVADKVRFDLSLLKPHLWNGVEDPYLYEGVTTLSVDGRKVDEVSENVGFRFFSVNTDSGFTLNGKPYQIHGVCRHQDREGYANALLPAQHREDLSLIREMGANAIRLSHYPQADYFHQLMDKAGVIGWAEIPLIGEYVNSEAFRMSTKEQMKELIYQNYNHPSILFWGLFNELGTDCDSPTSFLKELNAMIYSIDSTRLTTAATNTDADFNFVTSLMCWNRYDGWYYGEPKNLGDWADYMHKNFPQLKLGVSEYGAGASIDQHQEKRQKPDPGNSFHPENWQTYYHIESYRAISSRPFIWGSFVWNMFDFAVAHRNEGDKIGRNDKGLVTYDRKVRKDAFYFYKANWNQKEKFVYIAERRFDVRTENPVNITVFSNLPKVELLVNGVSLGVKKVEDLHLFQWKDVFLKPGNNHILVKSGNHTDTCEWYLN